MTNHTDQYEDTDYYVTVTSKYNILRVECNYPLNQTYYKGQFSYSWQEIKFTKVTIESKDGPLISYNFSEGKFEINLVPTDIHSNHSPFIIHGSSFHITTSGHMLSQIHDPIEDIYRYEYNWSFNKIVINSQSHEFPANGFTMRFAVK